MEKLNYYLSFLIFIFFLVFLCDYFLILKSKLLKIKKNKKTKRKISIMEVDYLVLRFKLNKELLLTKKNMIIIAILNAFIISLTSTMISFLPIHMSFKFLIAFVLLFALIYSIYEIYGRYLAKKAN